MKKLLLILVLGFSSLCLKAQNQQDAALWTNIYLEKKIHPRLYLHLNQETRFMENISRMGFAYADAGMTAKISDWLNSTIAYVFIEKLIRHKSEYYSTRHQYYFNLVFKYEYNDFHFSLREQVQSQVNDYYSSDDFNSDYYLRNKLTIKYKLNRRVTPYIAEEVYYTLNDPMGNEIDRTRHFAGFFYKLNKSNELEMYYLLQLQHHSKVPHQDFILGIGFSHEF